MSLEQDLKKVAVIGAAGKMGSGITLLLLIKMAELELRNLGKIGSGEYRLKAIDTNEEGLVGLKKYLRQQLLRYAEKNINSLRESFSNQPKLISNEEMIQTFIQGSFDNLFFGTSLEDAKGSSYIFEAAIEDIELKATIFKSLKNQAEFFFTNTSSIPIHLLAEKGEINGRLIGFHFYNPPAVQRLVEIIAPSQTDPELKKAAHELATLLHKIPVYSADVAGFIGNGYFIREICLAFEYLKELSKKHSLEIALQIIDKMTRDFLLRPMGVFQLLDYVGLGVAKNILTVMRQFLKDPILQESMIDEWINLGIRGGQNFDGTPKDGLFQYSDSQIIKVFHFEQKEYVPLTELDLGKNPFGYTWKSLQKDSKKEEKIHHYFLSLSKESSLGAKLALRYLEKCQLFAKKLVEDGVAKSLDDVGLVLKNGFYHLYAPEEVMEALHGKQTV